MRPLDVLRGASRAAGTLVPRLVKVMMPPPGQMAIYQDAATKAAFVMKDDGTTANLEGGGAPSGAAGGDLTGTYPNPTIATAAVTLVKQANLATQRVIGRNTAGSGVPEAVTASQLLDWRSSTQGDLLVRGSATWDQLAIGSAGRVLQVQTGQAQKLAWRIPAFAQIVYSNGTSGNVTYDGTATVLGIAPSGGTYSLTSDVECQTITMTGTAAIQTGGYRIRCWKLVGVAGNVIHDDGNNASGSTAGALRGDAGTLAVSWTAGATGRSTTGNGAGSSLNGAPAIGGVGGTGGSSGQGQSGGVGGTMGAPAGTAGTIYSGVGLLAGYLGSSAVGNVQLNSSTGGGAGGFQLVTGGYSGGGGSGCGHVWLYAYEVDFPGTVRTNGGNGGAGSAGTNSNAGGGGGGGGGLVVLVTEHVTTSPTLQANGGTGGAGAGTGTAGSAGNVGTTVTIQAAA